MNSYRFGLLLLAGNVLAISLWADDTWPRFRGHNGSGVSEESGIPTSWTDQDYNWKVDLPGTGHGSPVIWHDKLFVNCASDDGTARILQCRSTQDGSLLWSHEFQSTNHNTHKFNSYATSTPVVDAEHVYTAWGTPEELAIVALTHTGEPVWEARNIGKVAGSHGFGTSPIVHGDLVIIANDTNEESSLIALDRHSGEIAWETERPGGRLNFSTPCVYASPSDPDRIIFVAWPIGVTAVDAASGKIVWEKGCFDPEKGQRAVGSPIVFDELVLATSAFANNPKHLVVLKPSHSSAEEHFRVDHSTVPHIPSLLAYDGLLYAWADKGICTCYEIASGKRVWQERVGGNFFSSPICVKGVIYCVDADGHCVVIKAGRTYQELARIDLGEPTRATPAVAGGQMFLRTFSSLMAIGNNSAESPSRP